MISGNMTNDNIIFSGFSHLRYCHLNIVPSMSITNNQIPIFWTLIVDLPLNFCVSWTNQIPTWLLFNALNPINWFENVVIRNGEITSIEREQKNNLLIFLSILDMDGGTTIILWTTTSDAFNSLFTKLPFFLFLEPDPGEFPCCGIHLRQESFINIWRNREKIPENTGDGHTRLPSPFYLGPQSLRKFFLEFSIKRDFFSSELNLFNFLFEPSGCSELNLQLNLGKYYGLLHCGFSFINIIFTLRWFIIFHPIH